MTLQIPTPLSVDTERLIHETIGCCILVHRELGPGLVEAAYHRAVCYELSEHGIRFEREKAVAIRYRGRPIYVHRLDLVIDDSVLLELKAVDRVHPVHCAQVLSCLRAAKLPVGLLINFNVPVLREGVKRLIAGG